MMNTIMCAQLKISDLYEQNLISARLRNCLQSSGLLTLEDILSDKALPQGLIHQRNWGRRSLEELKVFREKHKHLSYECLLNAYREFNEMRRKYIASHPGIDSIMLDCRLAVSLMDKPISKIL